MTDRIDYGTLLEVDHTDTLAEDEVGSSAVDTYGSDEGFQVDRVWIYPPFNDAGALENLTVQLVIDGESFDLVHLHSSNHPPYLSNSKWLGIPLGKHNSNNPIENTCLKGKHKLQVKYIGGQGGVTGDFKIKVLGDYFNGDAAVVRLLGSIFNPVAATFFDVQRNQSVVVNRPVGCSIDALSEMSGGAPKAPKPRVLPYVAFAWNKAATSANQEYNYSLVEQHVDKAWEDMTWDFDRTEALLITHLAANEVANSKELFIEIADLEYPIGHFDIRQFTNELPFSNFDTEQPPKVYNLLIHDEKAMLKVRDNGTPVDAKTLLVGVWGKKFELA